LDICGVFAKRANTIDFVYGVFIENANQARNVNCMSTRAKERHSFLALFCIGTYILRSKGHKTQQAQILVLSFIFA
jgi:hypothetical protein